MHTKWYLKEWVALKMKQLFSVCMIGTEMTYKWKEFKYCCDATKSFDLNSVA